jgi:hypothetical protein
LRYRQHRFRSVDACNVQSRFGERQRNASSATGELEDRPAGLTGDALVEGHIAADLRP